MGAVTLIPELHRSVSAATGQRLLESLRGLEITDL